MARERYLRESGEETIHSNVITANTTKKKAANWWYYNKKKLLFGIITAGLVISFICSIVFKVNPDYTIAIMTEAQIEAGILAVMEDQLRPYCDDRNGDGQVVVAVVNYPVVDPNSEASAYDMAQQQAATVRFVSDMSTGESMIWLHDQVGYYCMSDQEDLFKPLDGTLDDPLMMQWNDVKAFQDMDFSSYQNEYITAEQITEFMSKLRVSFRMLEGSAIERDKNLTSYFYASETLFNNLISGTKLEG